MEWSTAFRQISKSLCHKSHIGFQSHSGELQAITKMGQIHVRFQIRGEKKYFCENQEPVFTHSVSVVVSSSSSAQVPLKEQFAEWKTELVLCPGEANNHSLSCCSTGSILTLLCVPPEAEGPLPVQAPEHWWADDQGWGFDLRGPNAAEWGQRGLGDWHLTPYWLQGLPPRKLHWKSPRVGHLGQAQVTGAFMAVAFHQPLLLLRSRGSSSLLGAVGRGGVLRVWVGHLDIFWGEKVIP